MIWFLDKKIIYIKFLAIGLEMSYFSSLLLIISEGAPQILVLVVPSFEHIADFVLLLDMLKQIGLYPLGPSLSFFGPSLPSIKFPIDGLDLR